MTSTLTCPNVTEDSLDVSLTEISNVLIYFFFLVSTKFKRIEMCNLTPYFLGSWPSNHLINKVYKSYQINQLHLFLACSITLKLCPYPLS